MCEYMEITSKNKAIDKEITERRIVQSAAFAR